MTQVTIGAIPKSGTGSPGGNKDFLSNATQESFDVALTNEEFGFVLAHLQFWINLPSKNKAEKPEHLVIGSHEVPQKALPDESGWIKVIAGDYQKLHSKISNYSQQFYFSFHLSWWHQA